MELGRMQTPGTAMNSEYKLAKPLASSWWLCMTAARRLFSTAISSKVVRKPCRDLESAGFSASQFHTLITRNDTPFTNP
jgi:hypothetical protein